MIFQGLKAKLVQSVHEDRVDHAARLELLDRVDLEARSGRAVLRVSKVPRVQSDHKDPQAQREQQAQQEQQDQPEQQDHKDLQAQSELQAQQA